MMTANEIKQKVMVRLYAVYGVVALVMLVVIVRILTLQGIDPEDVKSEIATIQLNAIHPMRGDICATDGRILATSMPTYTIHWDLRVPALTDSVFNKNVDSLARCVSQLFGDLSAEEYAQRFRTARAERKAYFEVKKCVTFTQIAQVRKFPLFCKGRYKSGVIIEREYIRTLPHKHLASRTIGYAREGDKSVGMEGAFNEKLSGRDGLRYMIKYSSGDWIPANTYNEEEEVMPEDGYDIISTIDVNIQDIVDKSLANMLSKHNAAHGIAIVMEVRTGKIRAIANLDNKGDGNFVETHNTAIGLRMDPGSTFKLASMIAVLEKGKLDISDSVDVGNGTYMVDKNLTIRDDHKTSGYMTLETAFKTSSNVGILKAVLKTFGSDPSEFIDRLYQMHLNKPTGIDIEGEATPYIKYPDDPTWSGSSLPEMSIGYEVLLTPLQTLTFYNAVANGGKMVKPHLMESVRSHGETIEIVPPEVLNSSICSKETLAKVNYLLKEVVENGTARNIKTPHYAIAGKTGTAQVAKDKSGYIDEYLASFVGYFPADAPKYSCIVAINAPASGNYYGGSLAAPVFRNIADKLFSHDREMHSGVNFDVMKYAPKNVLPAVKIGDREILDRLFSTFNMTMDTALMSQTQYVCATPRQAENRYHIESVSSIRGNMPDVRGMGLRDAMFLLQERKLKVTVVGRGVVKKQTIQPGAKISDGAKVTIELG